MQQPQAQPRASRTFATRAFLPRGRRPRRGPSTCARRLAALSIIAGVTPGEAGPAHTGLAETPALVEPVAVFGGDQRVAIPLRFKALRDKIGLFFNRRSRTVCTAFCVAPDIVATAGHCLHRPHGERPPHPADFWFARNYDAERHFERIAGSMSGAAAQHVMSGTMELSVRPPIDASKDWALVRLSSRACSRGVLAIGTLSSEAMIAEAAAKRIVQVSYHRDFTPWKLAYSQPCGVERSFETADWASIVGDFADPTQLVLHTCDTGDASSGSPLLLDAPDGLKVVGINVGTYVRSKVLMEDGQIKKRLKADTVANTAVNSSAFAGKLATFQQAQILASPEQIRQLQTALHQRDLYGGARDGTYGAKLRSAIEAYEGAQGLPVTGLATQALLKRLHDQHWPRRRPATRGS